MVNQIANILQEHGHLVECLFEESPVPPGVGLFPKVKSFFSGLYSFKAIQKVRHIVDAFHPDVVQIQNLYPSLSPWILPVIKKKGIPIIMRCANYRLVCPSGMFLSHEHLCEQCKRGREYWCILKNCENSLPKSLGYALRNYIARIFRLYHDNVTLYYTLSEFQKNKLIESGFAADRIEIIPNAINISKEIRNSQGNYVAFVGRGSPEKGVSVFLEAAKKLPKISFRLAGDFWRMPEIMKNKYRNVEFVGHLTKSELDEFYYNCRFLVFPSICYESFGLVVIEAMLHGKPVICSNIAGLPEIVDNGIDGLLFEPNNSLDLSAKINFLLNKPDLCLEMGRIGREKVLQNFSPTRYYNDLMLLYHRAMELHGKRTS